MVDFVPFNPAPFDAHAQMLNLIGENKAVLDVGCSGGAFAEQLKKRGCYVVGVELDPKAAMMAKAYCDEVICHDVQELDEVYQRFGFFDVVLLGDVLEHLVNPGHTLALLKRYLRQDGYMVISVPNVANYAVRLNLLFGRFNYDSNLILLKQHLRFFTLASVKKKLLSEANLQVQRLSVTPGLFCLPIYHNTLERALGRFHWYRYLEYLASSAFKTLFGFQFIMVAVEKRESPLPIRL